MLTKLRAPEGKTVSLEGRPLDIADDGSVTVHPRDADVLRSHGFEDWHDNPGAGGDIETMTHAQLVEAAVQRTREEASKLETEKLRDYLRGRPAAPPVPVSEENIGAMSRKDLFAYLAANGVSIGPATKDDGLRAAALDTFHKTKAPA